MSMFRQYNPGTIRPVVGIQEAGANIASMTQQSLNIIGKSFADGLKRYSEQKNESETLDAAFGQMALDIKSKGDALIATGDPVFAEQGKRLLSYYDQAGDFASQSLAKKRGIFTQGMALQRGLSEDLSFYAAMREAGYGRMFDEAGNEEGAPVFQQIPGESEDASLKRAQNWWASSGAGTKKTFEQWLKEDYFPGRQKAVEELPGGPEGPKGDAMSAFAVKAGPYGYMPRSAWDGARKNDKVEESPYSGAFTMEDMERIGNASGPLGEQSTKPALAVSGGASEETNIYSPVELAASAEDIERIGGAFAPATTISQRQEDPEAGAALDRIVQSRGIAGEMKAQSDAQMVIDEMNAGLDAQTQRAMANAAGLANASAIAQREQAARMPSYFETEVRDGVGRTSLDKYYLERMIREEEERPLSPDGLLASTGGAIGVGGAVGGTDNLTQGTVSRIMIPREAARLGVAPEDIVPATPEDIEAGIGNITIGNVPYTTKQQRATAARERAAASTEVAAAQQEPTQEAEVDENAERKARLNDTMARNGIQVSEETSPAVNALTFVRNALSQSVSPLDTSLSYGERVRLSASKITPEDVKRYGLPSDPTKLTELAMKAAGVPTFEFVETVDPKTGKVVRRVRDPRKADGTMTVGGSSAVDRRDVINSNEMQEWISQWENEKPEDRGAHPLDVYSDVVQKAHDMKERELFDQASDEEAFEMAKRNPSLLLQIAGIAGGSALSYAAANPKQVISMLGEGKAAIEEFKKIRGAYKVSLARLHHSVNQAVKATEKRVREKLVKEGKLTPAQIDAKVAEEAQKVRQITMDRRSYEAYRAMNPKQQAAFAQRYPHLRKMYDSKLYRAGKLPAAALRWIGDNYVANKAKAGFAASDRFIRRGTLKVGGKTGAKVLSSGVKFLEAFAGPIAGAAAYASDAMDGTTGEHNLLDYMAEGTYQATIGGVSELVGFGWDLVTNGEEKRAEEDAARQVRQLEKEKAEREAASTQFTTVAIQYQNAMNKKASAAMKQVTTQAAAGGLLNNGDGVAAQIGVSQRDSFKRLMRSRIGNRMPDSVFERLFNQRYPATEPELMERGGYLWQKMPNGEFKSVGEAKSSSGVSLQDQRKAMMGVFGTPNADGSFTPQQIGKTGMMVSGLFRGGDSALTDFTNDMGTYSSARGALDELEELVDVHGKSLSPTMRRRGEVLYNSVLAGLRSPILGPGVVSEYDRQILEKILSNPAGIWTIDSSSREAIERVRKLMDEGIVSRGELWGLRIYNNRGTGTQNADEKSLRLTFGN